MGFYTKLPDCDRICLVYSRCARKGGEGVMDRKSVWAAAAALLLAFLLPLCAAFAEEAPGFVDPTRPPNAPEYDTKHPEDLQEDQIVASSFILMERESGDILMSRNEENLMYPASTTKIMTALIALQFCDDLDTQLTISETANTLEEGASVVPFKTGETVTLRDALYGMMLKSGNEAANAVAEFVAGDIDSFVSLMNETAAALGCTSTHFVNPNGLHNDVHYTTAHDLARIMDAAMDNEDFRTIISTPTWTLSSTDMNPARQITNSNAHILKDNNYYYRYSIGGKTGFTSQAGYCLVEAAEKDGTELIAVIMYSGKYSRWPDTSRLFSKGFTMYKSITPEEIYAQNPTRLQLSSFAEDDVGEISDDGTRTRGLLTLRIEAVDPSRKVVITGAVDDVDAIAADYESYTNTTWLVEARAPVTAGEVMGVLTFYPSDQEPAKYNLVATRSVAARDNAPPTLDEIQRRVEEDDSLFPPFSLDWALPPILLAAAVLFGLFKARRLLFRRRRRKAKIPQPKKRYYT